MKLLFTVRKCFYLRTVHWKVLWGNLHRLHIEQTQAQHPPTSTHWWQSTPPPQKSEICERATPRGDITEMLKITLQNIFIHRSWLVERTSHPYPDCWIPDNSQATPENSSLTSSLDFILYKNFALFPLTSHRRARICSEQCLGICITSTSCVHLHLYNLIVFLNCKLLWIKVSAKWMCKCKMKLILLWHHRENPHLEAFF